MNEKVNFFIIGAPKCGTSALASYLEAHPNIAFSVPKEPHYFSTDLKTKRKIWDLEHYHAIFPKKGQTAKLGEGSVWYLYSENAPREIKSYNPDAKIIIMIRDPISFIESLHNQNLIGGHDKEKNINKCVEKSLLRGNSLKFRLDYIELSRFDKYIKKYKDAFGENVLVLLQEELKLNPRKVYLQVLNFIGAEDDGRVSFDIVNERRSHKYSLLKIILTINWSPISKMLSPLRKFFNVGSFGIYKRIMDFNSQKGSSLCTMSNETSDIIISELKNNVDELSVFLDKQKISELWIRFF